MTDDIRDLLGRYATGSLSNEERKRLFDAALEDQDLFDELAREQDLKELVDEPGARLRLIRALEPARRRVPWVLALAPVAILSAVLLVILMRPAPKPQQVATVKTLPAAAGMASSEVASTQTAPREITKSAPKPVGAPRSAKIELTAEKPGTATVQPIVDQPSKDAVRTEVVQVEAAASAPVPPAPKKAAEAQSAQAAGAQQFAPQQQNAPGGPKQIAAQRRVAVTGAAGLVDMKIQVFGFHYSLEIEGHLTIIPAVDGYLSVKSNDGTVLFGPKLSAAGIIVDIPLADGVSSVSITFSENSSPVRTTPTVRTERSGTVEGTGSLAISLKINSQQ